MISVVFRCGSISNTHPCESVRRSPFQVPHLLSLFLLRFLSCGYLLWAVLKLYVCGGSCTNKGDNCRFCGSRVLGVAGVLSILSRRSAGVSEGRRQLPHPEIEIRTLLEQLLELEHSAGAVADRGN